MSAEATAGFAAAAVALLGILVTLYLRWSARQVRVTVEVREAWKSPRFYIGTLETLASMPQEPTLFEATVVAINRGERPVYVEVLGLEARGEAAGFDDRLDSDVREVPPGGRASLAVDEETVDFDMRAGVRGFAEITGHGRVYSVLLVPVPPAESLGAP